MSKFSQEEINMLLSGIPLPTDKNKNNDDEKPVARLHNWYIDKLSYIDSNGEKKEGYVAHGNVTGHNILTDSEFIRTSSVDKVQIDMELEEVIVETRNTEYRCRLSECDYSIKDTYKALPELKKLSKKYCTKKTYELEDNSILIVLSDYKQYYFETALVKFNGKQYEGNMSPHIGTFQDSCLISFSKFSKKNDYKNTIDLRYFHHVGHLESYAWFNANLDVYLENTGENVLYYSTPEGLIKLEAGERKRVCKENAQADSDIPYLDRSDLYPAMIIDSTDN